MATTSRIHPAVIAAVKALIAALLAVAAATQIWLLPTASATLAQDMPEYAHLRIPYLTVGELLLAGFDLVLVAVWRLLSMTAATSVFSPRAFRWVDLIIGCIGFDTVLVLGLLIHNLTASLGPFLLMAALVALTIVGLALTLLMTVMRSLLSTAVAQHDELEAVI